ncbi:ABC transporter permease [Gardnerella sp. KA00255]|uniref:ABC transporter permease n=1 Tax=Gardnerella sp. KA00255 TaxID=2749073 RepID=UPI003BACF6E8
MKNLIDHCRKKYSYAIIVLRGLVKTDFKLRYQGSFLGVAWSALKPLMMFCVMYLIFGKFLRMTDGTSTYPVVLLLGISAWQFVQESTSIGLRSLVDRGDLLRKIHFPNYIVVVSATIGSLISFLINLVVVLCFAIFNGVHFTWRVVLLPISLIQLYVIAIGIALIMSTMYVYFRDILHIWEVAQQLLFYGMPIIYPLSYVINKGGIFAKLARMELLNPIAQCIQDMRHNLIAPDTQPTVWSLFGLSWMSFVPILLTILVFLIGIYVFKKNSHAFVEVM